VGDVRFRSRGKHSRALERNEVIRQPVGTTSGPVEARVGDDRSERQGEDCGTTRIGGQDRVVGSGRTIRGVVTAPEDVWGRVTDTRSAGSDRAHDGCGSAIATVVPERIANQDEIAVEILLVAELRDRQGPRAKCHDDEAKCPPQQDSKGHTWRSLH
jgi:hypothetical protein